MAKPLLPDELWNRIEPLLPPRSRDGFAIPDENRSTIARR